MIKENILKFSEKELFNKDILKQYDEDGQKGFLGYLFRNYNWSIIDNQIVFPEIQTEIKREYGLADATLYRWIKEYGKIKTTNNETTTNHEIKRLKKELAQAKEENEILKKAVAIFTQK